MNTNARFGVFPVVLLMMMIVFWNVIMLGDKLLMFLKDCSAVIFRVKAVKE
jgi:hypothetical protein